METNDLFQEDASLSSQYWETFARKRDLEPEKRLLLAVLDNGIRSYRQYLFTESRRFYEAHDWLFGKSDGGPFSFEYICDVLGISPGYLRETLRGWRDNRPAPERGARSREAARRYDGPRGSGESATAEPSTAKMLRSSRKAQGRRETVKCPILR